MGTKNSKEEKEIAQGIRNDMKRRNITDTQAQLLYLRDQKTKKRDANQARVNKVEMEIRVIEKMWGGVI